MPFNPDWPYFTLLRNRVEGQQSVRLTADPNEVYIIFSEEPPMRFKLILLSEIPPDPRLRLVLISDAPLSVE